MDVMKEPVGLLHTLLALWICQCQSFKPQSTLSPGRANSLRSQTSLRVASVESQSVQNDLGNIKLSIQDAVTRLLPTKFPKILPNETVLEAVELMGEAKRGSVMVVDKQNEFLGIFTERDFVTKIFQSEEHR